MWRRGRRAASGTHIHLIIRGRVRATGGGGESVGEEAALQPPPSTPSPPHPPPSTPPSPPPLRELSKRCECQGEILIGIQSADELAINPPGTTTSQQITSCLHSLRECLFTFHCPSLLFSCSLSTSRLASPVGPFTCPLCGRGSSGWVASRCSSLSDGGRDECSTPSGLTQRCGF